MRALLRCTKSAPMFEALANLVVVATDAYDL